MSQVLKVILQRFENSEQGTFGKLTFGSFKRFTLELPWKNNESNVSCIPVGSYLCRWTLSPRLKKYTYEILNVPKRAGIRIHSANLVCQVLGCIALGEKLGTMDGRKALLVSRPAVGAFEKLLGYKSFELEIK